MGAWLSSPFDFGDWQPIRWKFFLAIILFLFSWIAYYILLIIFKIVVGIIGKLLPPEIKVDDDIKTYCTKPFCKLGKVFVWYIAVILMDFPGDGIGEALNKIATFFLFWYLMWLGLAVITVCRETYLRQGKLTNREIQSIRMVTKIVKAVWVVIFGIIMLQNLGVDIANILAYTVVMVAALAWASKDIIGNFYGGFRIAFAKPFERGDHVKIESKYYAVEGTVAKVGLSDTTIKSTEGFVVIIPNRVFVREPLINLTKEVEEYKAYTEDEVEAYNPVEDKLKGKK